MSPNTTICNATNSSILLPVIINDFDTHAQSTGQRPWHEGTFSECANSHGDHVHDADTTRLDFHHDAGGAKGLVEGEPLATPFRLPYMHATNTVTCSIPVTYAPVLETCGCYELYEWHPGGASCSKWLPDSVPVHIMTVQYGETLRQVDQSRNGAAWNSIGLFQLAAGPQSIKVSNENTIHCATAHSCHVIFDAFKLEYRSAVCPHTDHLPPGWLRPHEPKVGCSPWYTQEGFVLFGLIAFVLVMIAWMCNHRLWTERLAAARTAHPKIVYMQIPLHIQNPGGMESDALAVLDPNSPCSTSTFGTNTESVESSSASSSPSARIMSVMTSAWASRRQERRPPRASRVRPAHPSTTSRGTEMEQASSITPMSA